MKKILFCVGCVTLFMSVAASADEGDDKKNELGLQSNITNTSTSSSAFGTTTTSTSSAIDAMGYWGRALGGHLVIRLGIGANQQKATGSSSGSLFIEPGVKYKIVTGHTFVPYIRGGLILGQMNYTSGGTTGNATLTGVAFAGGVSKFITQSISADLELFVRQTKFSISTAFGSINNTNTDTGIHLGVTSYF